MTKMMKQFKRFFTEAISYFQSVKQILESHGSTEPFSTVSLADLKTFAYDFAEAWKETAARLSLIKENGLIS
jgi:hypothetical protein